MPKPSAVDKKARTRAMKGSRGAAEGPVYQLKVTLKGSKPPAWRRLKVPGNVTLHRLHLMLQAAMG